MTSDTEQTTQEIASVAETAAFAFSGPQLAALISAAAQLVIEIENIRANAVDAWAQVAKDYAAAADAWTAAVETPVAQSALAAGHYNDARQSGAPATPAPDVQVSLSEGLSHVQV